MGRSAEYRRFAVRCLEIARATGDQQTKAVMLQMAQVWSRLADEADAARTAAPAVIKRTTHRLVRARRAFPLGFRSKAQPRLGHLFQNPLVFAVLGLLGEAMALLGEFSIILRCFHTRTAHKRKLAGF